MVNKHVTTLIQFLFARRDVLFDAFAVSFNVMTRIWKSNLGCITHAMLQIVTPLPDV